MGFVSDTAKEKEGSRGVNKLIATREKVARALDLRAHGLSYQEIADELGYKYGRNAYLLIQSGLKSVIRESAEQVLLMELQRLDLIQKNVLVQAIAGDLPYVAMMLKIMEQRAKYLGLFAPTKVDTRIESVKVDARTLGGDLSELSTEELDTFMKLMGKVKHPAKAEESYDYEAAELTVVDDDGGDEAGSCEEEAD